MKGAKHFTYVQYGCEMESKVVYILNHDIMASFALNSDPELPKSDSLVGVTEYESTHMPTDIIERC
jgi:hypothetical protein